jgi:malonate-semialdehyde dehydrogenase (acetylating)/methylmalonate-semialdehyde dehydrogenase
MTILEEPITEPVELMNYVDGDWVGSAGERKPVVNPATMKMIGTVPISTRAELNEAVEAAREAFPMWRQVPPLARARCMMRLKVLLEEHFEELSRIQTMEHGKAIDESRGETRRGIENVEVAAGIPSLMMGDFLEDIAAGIDEYLVRQPLGVFGVITPFNFPFMIGLWFAPYAVAAGNCVVLKPSSEDPMCQTRIVELAEEAGVPPGVWNVVHGGRDVVSGMLDHPDIEGICFVGSTPVGRDVITKRCGATGKRHIAQCGAKNFAVVMPDADVERTIAACMTSFYGNTGQRCLANANLVICQQDLSDAAYEAFYHEMVDAFVAAAEGVTLGYGLDESVQVGPLRDPGKKTRVVGYIGKGLEEGATLTLDGRDFELLGDWPRDAFLGPTVFEDVTPAMTIAREEIFGPVACIIRARDMEHAIEMIHDNPFGNAASIFTQSGRHARAFRYHVKCGNIGVNIGIAAPMAFFPFSGMKDSFFGTLHGQGREAIRFFTESKVVIERWF